MNTEYVTKQVILALAVLVVAFCSGPVMALSTDVLPDSPQPGSATVYSGSLSKGSGITSTWINTEFHWWVWENYSGGPWHYHYEIVVPGSPNTSHVVTEVTPEVFGDLSYFNFG